MLCSCWSAIGQDLAGRPVVDRAVGVMANRERTMRRASFSRLNPGCFRFWIGGFCLCAESAKRDETPWSIYDGPLATA